MWKHAMLVEDLNDGAPLVFYFYTSRAHQIGSYLSIILGTEMLPASGLGDTPGAALDDAIGVVKNARRYKIGQEAKQVGTSCIRAIRWNEQPILVHFRLGAPLSDALLGNLVAAGVGDARTLVAEEKGSPLYKSWGSDETLRWEQLPQDAARISGAARDDLDLDDDDFWSPRERP